MTSLVRVLLAGLGGAALALGAWVFRARSVGLKEDGPARSDEIVRLGSLLRAGRPVHLIWVHGIAQTKAGASSTFREELCRLMPELCGAAGPPVRTWRKPLAVGEAPCGEGAGIWRSKLSWARSRPFVDRYVFSSEDRIRLVVDEVNWWPLVFPLKCSCLVPNDARHLAGADPEKIALCARDADEANPDGPYFPWITPAVRDALLKRRAASGGGALLNRALKLSLMNWGLADTVAVLGAMRVYFHRAMDAAFAEAEVMEGAEADRHFVVVSESLGSFIVMDAFDQGVSGGARRVMSTTADLYFFANQFPLLDMARFKSPQPTEGPADGAPSGAASPSQSPSGTHDLLCAWATAERRTHTEGPAAAPARRQIVAFSDPSDLLTFYVPALADSSVKILNIYDRNAVRWFGLFADPLAAHVGHAANLSVVRWMLADDGSRKTGRTFRKGAVERSRRRRAPSRGGVDA